MLLRRRINEFNACVPYAGVAAGARPDEALLPALFALLPVPLAVGISVAPPKTQVRSTHWLLPSSNTSLDIGRDRLVSW